LTISQQKDYRMRNSIVARAASSKNTPSPHSAAPAQQSLGQPAIQLAYNRNMSAAGPEPSSEGAAGAFIGKDGVVSAAWLGAKLGQDVAAARLRDQDKMGGMSGEIRYIDAELTSGEKLAMVLKTAGSTPTRKAMGLAREAFFFNELAPRLESAGVPKSYFATGDMATGEMLLLMECFEGAIPTGVFFGGGNPNNWAVKDQLPELCEGNPTAAAVATENFKLYARLHAEFWKDESLLLKPWLRGTAWMVGEGQQRWEGAQAMASGAWAAIAKEREAGTSRLVWDDHLVKCLDSSFAKVNWESFLKEQSARPYALVHGDAHPHNALWVEQRTEQARLRLIDFEMVGVGSPGQEAGQYMISHATPELRRESEPELLRTYHTELLSALRQRG
jgi:aminoglycoside phosphotransferase (APT) family kinase protein